MRNHPRAKFSDLYSEVSPVVPLSPRESVLARRAVTKAARDSDDLALLLDVLGLADTAERLNHKDPTTCE